MIFFEAKWTFSPFLEVAVFFCQHHHSKWIKLEPQKTYQTNDEHSYTFAWKFNDFQQFFKEINDFPCLPLMIITKITPPKKKEIPPSIQFSQYFQQMCFLQLTTINQSFDTNPN